jgi:hypothetical protein
MVEPTPESSPDWPARFPALRGFFGAHFHQDWAVDATADEVVCQYIADASQTELHRAARELAELLALDLSEAALEEVLDRGFCSDHLPSDAGESQRLWLESIAGRIRDAL